MGGPGGKAEGRLPPGLHSDIICGQNGPTRPMVPHIITGGVSPLELYDGIAHYSTGYRGYPGRRPRGHPIKLIRDGPGAHSNCCYVGPKGPCYGALVGSHHSNY